MALRFVVACLNNLNKTIGNSLKFNPVKLAQPSTFTLARTKYNNAVALITKKIRSFLRK